MRILFLLVVLAACLMLGASMVYVDIGVSRNSILYGLGSLVGFLVAYKIQANNSALEDFWN